MTRHTSATFFEIFAELRANLRTVEATPIEVSLLLIHTVHRFQDHYRDLGIELPEDAASDLQRLDLPLPRVAELVEAILGPRVDASFEVLGRPDVDAAVVARASRQVGLHVAQLGKDTRDALAAIGETCTHRLDYGVRQFPLGSGVVQTPGTLARLTAEVLDAQPGMTVLDPNVGLARTLVELARRQAAAGGDPNALRYVGQEIEDQTALLGAMHLVLNGVTNFVIHVGDTLASPATEPETFDRVIADPPIGLTVPHLLGALEGDRRFVFGHKALPKAADWLFLQHGLTSLRPGGRAVFVTAHGPLFRGGSEGSIRQDLLATGWLSDVVALPSALYPNTALPLVLTVFDRPRAGELGRDDVLMIDASDLGVREGRIQVLGEETRAKLLTLLRERQGNTDIAVLVGHDRIHANKDAWQPNQYLTRPEKAGRDLSAIREDLQEALARLRDAERRVAEAFDELDR